MKNISCRLSAFGVLLPLSLLLSLFSFYSAAYAQESSSSSKPAINMTVPAANQKAAASMPTPSGSAVAIGAALGPSDRPKPIVVSQTQETIEERLARKITLDVRDMNIVDVIKFLALKGDFNVVTSKSVGGRATLYLKNVTIKDVLDIILISNNLAYQLQNDIAYIMSDAEFEATYGKKYNDKSEVAIVRLSYAKPSYVLSTLDNIKSSLGKIIIDEDTGSVVMIDTPQTLAEMKKALERMESPMETYVYTLQYAKADVVAEKLRPRVDANAVGSIVADERSNQLVVRALPGRKEEIEALIKSLDSKTKEVLIDARVMQVVFKPTFDAGIDWDLNFKDSPDKELQKLTFKNVFLNESALTSSNPLYSAFGKVAVGNINIDHFQASLRALKQVSDTKILASPKLLVTNNEEASIHVGDTVPYIISTVSGTGDTAIVGEDVRFVDVGLKLAVTPTINDDGFVTMRLKPEISTVVAKIESKGGGIPQINKTEVTTTVMVKDGISVILAGLKKDDKVSTKKGLPVLMDIPFLGYMFGATSSSITRTEIIIFITPHVVSGEDDYAKMRGTIKPIKNYEEEPADQLK
ncbi:MAG TPA: secretin N-terminal domain-containing protein [Candidatus Omnitrophota bacterium]|nr:secretin N-terminal domain-containing protein [Candidatus Omnitrophota bacterium]HPD85127.1 secretin N-terminal domain-containing protein [Candidatus Omnitrophota bacterium]HRZ03985.1 secretin N-terminal domain-containing protein [Candidatus Omnitrophota bacterium]